MKPCLSKIAPIFDPCVGKKHLSAFLLALFLFGNLVCGFSQTSSMQCPADLVQNIEPGTCGAKVEFPETEDNASNADYFIIYSHNSGAIFPVGTTRVTKQLLDQNGVPIATCSFEVTVIDTEAPVLSNCPANVSVNTGQNECGAVVTFKRPAVVESCTVQRKKFFYTGAPQYFVVPPGVTTIDVDATGGSGGHTFYNNSVYGFPGLGGEVFATIPVTPGQVLTLHVGGAGGDGKRNVAGSGGFNGGGNGSAVNFTDEELSFAAGGGGGATDIRVGGTTLSDRIIVAGGGGASGINQSGGDGGELAGEDAEASNSSSTAGSLPATGGTQTEGGKAGSYQNSYFAGNGTSGIGGNGSAELTGGGGGGGYFGGGGGSFGAGAGGSSYVNEAATDVFQIQGAQEGNGYISLSYNQPASLVQTEGLPSGSVFPVGETVNTFTAADAAGNTSTCSFTVRVTDNQKPVVNAPAIQQFSTTAASYKIPVASVTDNCGISSLTYEITGATTRSGSGADASGSFNNGTSIIHFRATDIHGNIETATTTVTVSAAQLIVTIPDVWAVSPGGTANTLYRGWGPGFVTLKAVPAVTKNAYSYEWTMNGFKTVISRYPNLVVFLPGEYTVTVTDAKGVKGTAKKVIYTEDVRCGKNDDKVVICKPGKGNRSPTSECVNDNKVAKLLEDGAYLGNCGGSAVLSRQAFDNDEAATIQVESGQQVVVDKTPELTKIYGEQQVVNKMSVYPNPTTGRFNISFSNVKTSKAEISILSQDGAAVQRKSVGLNGSSQTLPFNIASLPRGIYIVKVVTDQGLQTAKLLMQ